MFCATFDVCNRLQTRFHPTCKKAIMGSLEAHFVKKLVFSGNKKHEKLFFRFSKAFPSFPLSLRLPFAFNSHRSASCSVSFYFRDYFIIELFSCALCAVFVIGFPSEQMREEETRKAEGISIPEIYPTPPFRKDKKKTAVSGGIVSRGLALFLCIPCRVQDSRSRCHR